MEENLKEIQKILWKDISYDLLTGAYQNILKLEKYVVVLVQDDKRSEDLVEKLRNIEKEIHQLIQEVENEE